MELATSWMQRGGREGLRSDGFFSPRAERKLDLTRWARLCECQQTHTHDTYLKCAASTVPSMEKKDSNHLSKRSLRQHGVFLGTFWELPPFLKSEKSRKDFVKLWLVPFKYPKGQVGILHYRIHYLHLVCLIMLINCTSLSLQSVCKLRSL